MENHPKKLETVFKIVVLICIVVICVFLAFLYGKVDKLESGVATGTGSAILPPQAIKDSQQVDICGEDCKSQITQEVARAMATVSGTSKKDVVYQSVPVSGQSKITYIPIPGSMTTTSMEWADAPGTDIYIDMAKDYGKVSWVDWEAVLKVDSGNGKAFARLYDVTHKIGVNGSEVSASSATPTQAASTGNMSFWAGRNLYKVQIKSLNSYEVTFSGGRIKITR